MTTAGSGRASTGRASVPLHRQWRALGLVALGGTVGTAAREAVSLALQSADAWPVAVFVINISGALLLGALLESLARRGDDSGKRQTIRLLLGTGLLGGFTTYSALSTDSAALLLSGDLVTGIAYPLATVLAGAVATWVGIILASRRRRGAAS